MQTNVFDVIYRHTNKVISDISLVKPLKIREFVLLLLSLTSKLSMSKIAITYTIFTYETRIYFYLGASLGAILVAILHDLLFKKQMYLLIVIFVSFIAVFLIVCIFLEATNLRTETNDQTNYLMLNNITYFFLFGLTDNTVNFLLIYFVPAVIAANNIRPNGLSMPGTLFGLSMSLSFFFCYLFSVPLCYLAKDCDV